jgi:CHAT domain-containing protein
VSWLDVRQRGARAPLVVLNACELGSGAAMRSSDSFAAALNAAGSAHVIAAQWAVSEAASSQLLRTFYPALIETGDPALALRRAQLALRASRHFRHPWYWAGFTAFARRPAVSGSGAREHSTQPTPRSRSTGRPAVVKRG